MIKEVKWADGCSASDENRLLKQHGYIDDGIGGNISLCGKMRIGVDYRSERFAEIPIADKKAHCCKLCDKISKRLIEPNYCNCGQCKQSEE